MASVPSICNGISGLGAPIVTVNANATCASPPQPQRPPLNASLSVNALKEPLSPGGSRFRVSRVCLETEAEHSSEPSQARPAEAPFERSNSAPAGVPSRFTVTPVNGFNGSQNEMVCEVAEEKPSSAESENGGEEEDEDDDFVGHAVSKPVTIAGAPAREYGAVEDEEEEAEEKREEKESLGVPAHSILGRTSPPWFMYPSVTSTPSDGAAPAGGERKRKISFKLPEGETDERGDGDSYSSMRNNRRMSTPAMPVSSCAAKKKLTFKLCKRLESLDLRSTVPLSPTRLLEGWGECHYLMSLLEAWL